MKEKNTCWQWLCSRKWLAPAGPIRAPLAAAIRPGPGSSAAPGNSRRSYRPGRSSGPRQSLRCPSLRGQPAVNLPGCSNQRGQPAVSFCSGLTTGTVWIRFKKGFQEKNKNKKTTWHHCAHELLSSTGCWQHRGASACVDVLAKRGGPAPCLQRAAEARAVLQAEGRQACPEWRGALDGIRAPRLQDTGLGDWPHGWARARAPFCGDQIISLQHASGCKSGCTRSLGWFLLGAASLPPSCRETGVCRVASLPDSGPWNSDGGWLLLGMLPDAVRPWAFSHGCACRPVLVPDVVRQEHAGSGAPVWGPPVGARRPAYYYTRQRRGYERSPTWRARQFPRPMDGNPVGEATQPWPAFFLGRGRWLPYRTSWLEPRTRPKHPPVTMPPSSVNGTRLARLATPRVAHS